MVGLGRAAVRCGRLMQLLGGEFEEEKEEEGKDKTRFCFASRC